MAEEATKTNLWLWVGIGATTALVAIVGVKMLGGPQCDSYELTDSYGWDIDGADITTNGLPTLNQCEYS